MRALVSSNCLCTAERLLGRAGCFLQGTFRMLFSLLDLDKNGRLDVNELAWVGGKAFWRALLF